MIPEICYVYFMITGKLLPYIINDVNDLYHNRWLLKSIVGFNQSLHENTLKTQLDNI